jgi:hypothetical protein
MSNLINIPMDEHIFEVIFQTAKEQGIESYLAHNYAVAVADIVTKTGNDNAEKVMSELSGLATGLMKAMKSLMPANAEVVGLETNAIIDILHQGDNYIIRCTIALDDKRIATHEAVDEIFAKKLADKYDLVIENI